MLFSPSERSQEIKARVMAFMEEHIHPNIPRYRALDESGNPNDPEGLAFIQELRMRAKREGLWNLFLPHLREDEPGTGLSNLEFAPIFEEMAKVGWAPEVFNCNAPNTGNMELLNAAANEEQRQKWLRPLLEGECTSCFIATEPAVASSDATNYETSIVRDGDEYVINGHKWFISRALHPDCRFGIIIGKSDPDNPARHAQHSVVVVPFDTPGIEIGPDLKVLNHHSVGGHPEVRFRDVRVPAENLLGEEGGGFAVMQSRMGPGRIHYGMRSIGMAEVALGMMIKRSSERVAFGKRLYEHGSVANDIGRSRIEIDQARLLTLHTAKVLDEVGVKAARKEIAMLKIVAAEMLKNVTERAMRVHGAMGLSDRTSLVGLLGAAWTIGTGDGPSEVHLPTISKIEIRDHDPVAFEKFYPSPSD